MINCFPISSSPRSIKSNFQKISEPKSVKKPFSQRCHNALCQTDGKKNISYKQKGKSTTICKNVKIFLFSLSQIARLSQAASRNYLRITILPLLILLCASFTISGCIRQDADKPHSSAPGQVTSPASADRQAITFTSGSLYLPGRQNSASSIYIDVHDAKGKQLYLPKQLEQQAKDDFTIVETPSKATHILHVTILHAGACSEAEIEKMVADGFGAPSTITGKGGAGLLADALLVKRRVPDDKKERIQFLKNVSARNALESTQMRLGIFSDKNPGNETLRQLEQKLASSIDAALNSKT